MTSSQFKHEPHAQPIHQVGDLIDRGNHSELVVEIMRQLILQSTGKAIFLIGNHEELIIEGDINHWAKDEMMWTFDSNKARPGVMAHDVIMTGKANHEQSLAANFDALEGSIGSLLLCQHLVLFNHLDDQGKEWLEQIMEPTWKATGTSLKKIETVIQSGGWKLHKYAATFLQKLQKASEKRELYVPGRSSHGSKVATFSCMQNPMAFRLWMTKYYRACLKRNSFLVIL